MARRLLPAYIERRQQPPRQCFYPNGDLASGDWPCSDSEVTMCCGEGHTCMSNGFCDSGNEYPYIRGSCTDEEWGPGCTNACLQKEFAGWGCNVADCLVNNRYCCAGSGRWASAFPACCGEDTKEMWFTTTPGKAVVVAGPTPSIITTTSTSSSTTFSPTTITTVETTRSSSSISVPPSASDAKATSSSPTTSSSSATIVPEAQPNTLAIGLGAGLGGALFLICALALGMWLGRKWALKKVAVGPPTPQPYNNYVGPIEYKTPEVYQNQPYVINHVVELGPGQPRGY